MKIMIEANTGEIFIEAVSIIIGTDFSRREFRASPLAESSSVFIRNEPYCSYQIGTYEMDGLSFIISLWFCGECLDSVELVHHTIKDFGSSWADWSEEKELKRKAIQTSGSKKNWWAPPPTQQTSPR